MLNNKASSSMEKLYQLEDLITKAREDVVVLLYFSGKKWNFVMPLSFMGIVHNMEDFKLQGRSNVINAQEMVRHIFHFFSKEVQMDSNDLILYTNFFYYM